MGHDTHFLQRLERLKSNAQLDFALRLYRDAELVRSILDRARLPEAAERVALALEDRPGSPHIIVTRSGRFVTCLGANMSVGPHPVVARAQINRASEELGILREAMKRLSQDSEADDLIARIFTGGMDLSREDFMALGALVPIIGPPWIETVIELIQWLGKFDDAYRTSRYRRLTAETRGNLRRVWEYTWALGHLLALYERFGSSEDMTGPMREPYDRVAVGLAQASVRTMFMPTMLRGMRLVAHGGKKRVPLFKQELGDPHLFISVMMNLLPLIGIALRHSGVRAEVQKTVLRCKRKLDEPDRSERERDLLQNIFMLGERVLADEDFMRLCHREAGIVVAMEFAAMNGLPAGHPYRFERPEDVPEDIARALVCRMDRMDLYLGRENQLLFFAALPWAINAEAEELYLPQAALEAYHLPWDPEPVRHLREVGKLYYLRNRPAQREPTPGRNDPCPCGSGKKYKRCCGAA